MHSFICNRLAGTYCCPGKLLSQKGETGPWLMQRLPFCGMGTYAYSLFLAAFALPVTDQFCASRISCLQKGCQRIGPTKTKAMIAVRETLA
jgi:hypothetical protein